MELLLLCDTLMWDTTFVNASAAQTKCRWCFGLVWFGYCTWVANDSYTYSSNTRHECQYLRAIPLFVRIVSIVAFRRLLLRYLLRTGILNQSRLYL
jgi:hypothetical protein